MKKSSYWFTLIEMLIIIGIIGILATALIPRFTGALARARDVTRASDLRQVSSALEVYASDHWGSYPSPIYAYSNDSGKKNILFPSAFAQDLGSSLSSIQNSLSPYLTTIPKDPNNMGIKAASDGNCISEGSDYAYLSDGTRYAATAVNESKKGNSSSCSSTIDRNSNGDFQKVGKGLVINISAPPTDASCFGFSNGIVTSYRPSCPNEVVIPSSINGIPVTEISDRVFAYRNSITSIVLPNTIKKIGITSMAGTSITSLIIPDSVTEIGMGAFSASFKLTSLYISKNIKIIPDYAFQSNQLTEITLPENLTYIWQEWLSRGKLTTVSLPNSLTGVGRGAFMWNELTSVQFGNNIKTIAASSFSQNRFTAFSIPSSVTNIASDAFSRNGFDKMRGNNALPAFVAWTNQSRNLAGNNRVKKQ